MPFPVIYEGQVLFRFGRPAMSLDCCCDNRICLGCRYFYYEFSVAGEAYYDFEAGDPPEVRDCTLYYSGRGRTPIDDPVFTAYNTHLWIYESCIYNDNGASYRQLSEALDIFHEENVDATNSGTEAKNFGLAIPVIGFPDEYGEPYYIGFMKSAFMPSNANYTIEDYLVGVPPNWGKCGRTGN